MASLDAGLGHKVNPFKLFNRKLLDFIKDLEPVIGHLPDYGVFSGMAKLLSRVDEDRNHTFFVAHVVEPYAAQIAAKDESFFLAESYAPPGSPDSSLVIMLKGIWGSLTPAEKEAIWAHMHLLVELSSACSARLARE